MTRLRCGRSTTPSSPPNLALIVAMGIYFERKAKRSMLDYSLSRRSMPWWLAGTRWWPTTFSADTPLAVTKWSSRTVSRELAVVVDARQNADRVFLRGLWRRAEVVTDVELTELRYSGRPAAFLRGIRAAYLGLIANIIVMAGSPRMAKCSRHARHAQPQLSSSSAH